MNIAIAQLKPEKGNIPHNIATHTNCINKAVSLQARVILFPELSLTGYEPALANELAMTVDDKRLDVFNLLSDAENITICVGFPARTNAGIQIGMLIFQPRKKRTLYAKQLLHADEMPYFTAGTKQVIIDTDDVHIAPAICYESLQPTHAASAKQLGAGVYAASVAKSQPGIDKAYKYYRGLAKLYTMPVLMSNCVGFCDNFESVGSSAVWNVKGELVAALGKSEEGIIVFDNVKETANKYVL